MSVDAPVLAIETSTDVGSVAVGIEGRAIAEVTLSPPVRHAAMVVPSIDHVLHVAGVARAELSGVVVGAGPGSFTGLRVAAATAKGLCHALHVPLFAYSSLMVLAVRTGVRDEPVCALLDARRGEVYAGCYRIAGDANPGDGRSGDATSDDGVAGDRVAHDGAVETLLAPVVRNVADIISDPLTRDALFVGEGVAANGATVSAAGVHVARPVAVAPSASALLWLVRHAAETGRVESAARWEPDYVRASSAERGVKG